MTHQLHVDRLRSTVLLWFERAQKRRAAGIIGVCCATKAFGLGGDGPSCVAMVGAREGLEQIASLDSSIKRILLQHSIQFIIKSIRTYSPPTFPSNFYSAIYRLRVSITLDSFGGFNNNYTDSDGTNHN